MLLAKKEILLHKQTKANWCFSKALCKNQLFQQTKLVVNKPPELELINKITGKVTWLQTLLYELLTFYRLHIRTRYDKIGTYIGNKVPDSLKSSRVNFLFFKME